MVYCLLSFLLLTIIPLHSMEIEEKGEKEPLLKDFKNSELFEIINWYEKETKIRKEFNNNTINALTYYQKFTKYHKKIKALMKCAIKSHDDLQQLHEALPPSSQLDAYDYYCSGAQSLNLVDIEKTKQALSNYFNHSQTTINESEFSNKKDFKSYKKMRKTILEIFYQRTKNYCNRGCSCAQCALVLSVPAVSSIGIPTTIYAFIKSHLLLGASCGAGTLVALYALALGSYFCCTSTSEKCLSSSDAQKVITIKKLFKDVYLQHKKFEYKSN